MKKKLLEQQQREKAIIESFAKTYNKIKRVDEQEVNEINIGKGIASLGLAASLAGSPDKAMAQTMEPKQVSMSYLDTANIATLPDEKATIALIRSFRQNPFSADNWSKLSRDNQKLFMVLKKLLDYEMRTGRFEQKDLQRIGAKYKTTPIAQQFIDRDKSDNKIYAIQEDDMV